MDDCYFKKKTSLHLQETGTPIQFVHRRSFDDPSGFRLHLNDCIELYAFVSGEADYVIEEECFSLSRGDLLAISPHAVHVPILKKPCAYERFYILIPLSFFSCIHPDPLSPFLSGNNARPKLTDTAKEKALSVLYEISRLCDREDGEGVQLTGLGLILQLLGLINDVKYCADPAPLQEPSGVPLLLRRILQYISLSPQEITSVESVAEAFQKYLFVGAPCYVKREVMDPKEAISLIHKAGGVAFFAHPYQTKLSDEGIFNLMKELKDAGLDGIEGYYSEYTPEMGEKFRKMAEDLDLMLSGGSDFHAAMKPHIRIGSGVDGNLAVDYALLEKIKGACGRG